MTRLLLALVLLHALTGCATIGQSDFTPCSLSDEGQCGGVADNYARATTASTAAATEPSSAVEPPATRLGPLPAADGEGLSLADLSTLTPGSDPVREPPQVIRIYLAAHETPEGFLVDGGYVYAEITPRRWRVGRPQPAPTSFSTTPTPAQ